MKIIYVVNELQLNSDKSMPVLFPLWDDKIVIMINRVKEVKLKSTPGPCVHCWLIGLWLIYKHINLYPLIMPNHL
jgi:hypothetical protein